MLRRCFPVVLVAILGCSGGGQAIPSGGGGKGGFILDRPPGFKLLEEDERSLVLERGEVCLGVIMLNPDSFHGLRSSFSRMASSGESSPYHEVVPEASVRLGGYSGYKYKIREPEGGKTRVANYIMRNSRSVIFITIISAGDEVFDESEFEPFLATIKLVK